MLQPQLLDYNLGKVSVSYFKAALKIYIHADPRLSDEECILRLQLNLPVEILFQKDLLQRPSTLFCVPQEYLLFKRFNYKMTLETNHFTRGIAQSLFFDEKDRKLAVSAWVTFARFVLV